jgi:hypothetical protein
MPVALLFSRSASAPTVTNPNANKYAVSAPAVSGLGLGCRGDLGAIGTAGTGNLSPRTGVTVTGPGGITVLNVLSPVIDTSLGGAATGYRPLDPQPAAPSATNYRGGAPSGTAGATRPFVNTVDLAGKPAGTYTVTTITQNMVKTGFGACAIGTAVPGQTTSTPGVITDVQTFVYNPWQHVFTDVFGGGGVGMNITPKQFGFKVGGQTSAVYPGTAQSMRLFALPGGDPGADPLAFLLPSDPAGCAANPQSCLPSTAVECPQATPSCVPRLVVINRGATTSRLQGIFDLQTKAFVALANVNGFQRVLLSLGTSNDAAYKALLSQLAAQAAAQGVDLMSILATKVRVRVGGSEVSLSLLNGLQIQPNRSGKSGIQIVSDLTVQAGLILNIYSKLGGPVCVRNQGDSDTNPQQVDNPATPAIEPTIPDAPDRYTALTDGGYTVEKSDLLPVVPRVGPAGALVGGPIYHIKGDFVSATPALVNTSMAVIGVDTAADEPNGYPIWIEPFVSTPTHVTVARTMDFIGTATWSASETPITGIGCLTVDFMLGAGVAVYNSPIDLGFGDIPIWDPTSNAVTDLIDQIDVAVQAAVDQVAGNPQVAALLQQILDTLPDTGVV